MSKSRKQAIPTATGFNSGPRPRLALVRGTGPAACGAAVLDRAVRDRLVRRARGRMANGFYERAAVRERLVDRLWRELFTS